MRYSFTELQPDYSEYKFPYNVSAYFEDGDDIQTFFSSGFLPTRTTDRNRFYLARSARINLSKFQPSSENRRIIKKTEWLESKNILLKDFSYDFKVQKFCKDYFDARFGKGKMSASAIKRIFTESWNNNVMVFSDTRLKGEDGNSKVIGYAVMYKDNNLEHYAYPFYDLSYFKENVGMGMMLNAVIDAWNSKKEYIYLGTIYEKNALYKTQFEGFEWWNGDEWLSDRETLKNLIN